ncbi:hypothetical protein HY605_02735 [Candidatus Peregrinibacteria bacterium]|nr:hypothetical protein [Candidatus Peregrinibacteria bacterium]
MKKTMQLLLFLMIVSGMIFTACGQAADEQPKEEEKVESVGVAEEDVSKGTDEEADGGMMMSDDDGAHEMMSGDTMMGDHHFAYEDGSYTEVGNYESPAGTESVTVTVALKADVVESVNVVSNAVNETSKKMQGLFIDGVGSLVVGKKLDEIGGLAQVNGSSLSPLGFNAAIEAIKLDAKG